MIIILPLFTSRFHLDHNTSCWEISPIWLVESEWYKAIRFYPPLPRIYIFYVTWQAHGNKKNKWFGSTTKYFNVGISKTSGTEAYEHNLLVLCNIFQNCPIFHSFIGLWDYEQEAQHLCQILLPIRTTYRSSSYKEDRFLTAIWQIWGAFHDRFNPCYW